jgi:copper transport protein
MRYNVRRPTVSLGWLAVAAFVGFLAALGPGAPASAHATLSSTDPQPGALLAAAPEAITLTFTEGVRPVSQRTRVVSPDRSQANEGEPRVEGTRLTIPLRDNLAKGTYLVTYRVISADSHPIAGSFTFSVGEVSVNPPATTDVDTQRADPVVAFTLGVARYLGYAGLVLVVGPLLFLSKLWPRRLSRKAPTRLVAIGLATLGVSTAAEMYLQGPYTAGTSLFGVSAEALNEAMAGTYGTTHAVRLGVLAAIAVMLRGFVRRTGPSTVDLAVVTFLAVIGVGTWPLSGHPGASPAPAVSLIADAAHLTAMAVWLGGLVVLLTVLLPKASARELAAILPVWSSWAMLAVVILALTGTAQAIIEVASLDALFDTQYGRLVIAKAALLAVVVMVAWYSRRLVTRFVWAPGRSRVPANARVTVGSAARRGSAVAGRSAVAGSSVAASSVDDGGPDDGGSSVDDGGGSAAGGGEPPVRSLRRGVLIELAITAVVLALAAALVQTPPARSVAAAPVAEPIVVTMTNDLFVLRAELEPGLVGPNTMHLYAFDAAGLPKKVLEWKVTAVPVDGSVEPVAVPALPLTPDHAVTQPTFPTPGQWELRFTLRVSDVDQATVSQRVAITE